MAQTNIEVVISARDRFTGTANKVLGTLNRMDRGVGRVGKGFGQLGAGIARAGLVVGGAAFGALTVIGKKTIDWETALAGVNKTMDLTDTELATLGTQIRGLATEIPLAATEIAGLVEQAGALGIAKEDVLQFAKAAATIGVTTNVSADQAASALGGLSTLLGLTGKDFERFGSALVDLGNKGASTEDQIIQIAERAAGVAGTIGLSTDELLAWSSALANAKLAPDVAGTSFQTLGLEVQRFARKGGTELKVLAKVAGVTGQEFRDLFEKDASGALEKFIDGLARLKKGERADVLEALGFNEARMRRMLLGLANAEEKNDNVSKSLNISASAWKANTAAAEEADKRYGTVASKLTLLNAQFTEAALVVGEGFLPALGRTADKLKKVLADPTTRGELTKLGQDIGRIIDGIDWREVADGAREFVSVLKVALDITKGILEQVNKLPTEVKAAGLGLLALNAGSGGLVGQGLGNIVGGIGESATRTIGSKIPGAGRLFAQPVFVINWPPGMIAGGGGGILPTGGKGGSLLGKAFNFIIPAAVGVAIAEQLFPGGLSGLLGTVGTVAGTNKPRSVGTPLRQRADRDPGPTGKRATESIKPSIDKIPPAVQRAANFTANQQSIAARENAAKVTAKVDAAGLRTDQQLAIQRGVLLAQKITAISNAAAQAIRDASMRSSIDQTKGAVSAGARSVGTAIRQSRPITNVSVKVNVTGNSVTRAVNTTTSYGQQNGSRNTPRNGARRP